MAPQTPDLAVLTHGAKFHHCLQRASFWRAALAPSAGLRQQISNQLQAEELLEHDLELCIPSPKAKWGWNIRSLMLTDADPRCGGVVRCRLHARGTEDGSQPGKRYFFQIWRTLEWLGSHAMFRGKGSCQTPQSHVKTPYIKPRSPLVRSLYDP